MCAATTRPDGQMQSTAGVASPISAAGDFAAIENATELKRYFDVMKEKRRRALKKQQAARRAPKINLEELYKRMDDDMHDAINRAIKNAPQPARVVN